MAVTRAQRVQGHLSAGRDHEQAHDREKARQHYLAALALALKADKPAIREAVDRVSARRGLAKPPSVPPAGRMG